MADGERSPTGTPEAARSPDALRIVPGVVTVAAQGRATQTTGPEAAAGRSDLAGRLTIGIPTVGRAPILTPTLYAIAAQTRLPDRVLVAVTAETDIAPGAADGLPFDVEILPGRKGLCTQRNRILDALAPDDVVLMLDDDFLMAPDYLARLETLLASFPGIVLATGTVLADGVVGPGLSPDEGANVLAADEGSPEADAVEPAWSGYGCNFALRMAPIRRHGLRFDEALPLYGWLEDVDFSRQIAAYGLLVRSGGLRGVHLGTKLSRSPGLRLGYSQIANPVYLRRKGTMSRRHAREMILRSLGSNVIYSFAPRPWTDSRGRLRGNLVALGDWLRGRVDPGRAREF